MRRLRSWALRASVPWRVRSRLRPPPSRGLRESRSRETPSCGWCAGGEALEVREHALDVLLRLGVGRDAAVAGDRVGAGVVRGQGERDVAAEAVEHRLE